MKKILIHLEADEQASVFDQITAYDAGVDQILAYSRVKPEEVANLVYGGMFTRGGELLRNTAFFIGGTQVSTAETLWKTVQKTFFGEVRLSVMFDANGCNTTASALVRKLAAGRDIRGKKALVLAGTGPVGIRVATLLSREGCDVFLSSRKKERAEEVCTQLQATGVLAQPMQIASSAECGGRLGDIQIIAGCGAPGICLIERDTWMAAPNLEVMADINAVDPLGIEGIKVMDDGKVREGKVCYGAIAIGNLKMKVHHRAIQTLFERHDRVLDLEAIYALTLELEE